MLLRTGGTRSFSYRAAVRRKLLVCRGKRWKKEKSSKDDKRHIPWLQRTREARDRLPSRAAGRQAQEEVAGAPLPRDEGGVLGGRNRKHPEAFLQAEGQRYSLTPRTERWGGAVPAAEVTKLLPSSHPKPLLALSHY